MNIKYLGYAVIGALIISLANVALFVQVNKKIDTVSTMASSTAAQSNSEGQAITQVLDFMQKEFPSQINNYVSGQVASTTQ